MLEINVGSIDACRCRPYVYVGFSCTEHIVYVGQTLDKRGFMGRWTDHLSRRERSSFFCRLAEYDENAFDRITDLRILAWDLGDHPSFHTLETSHREGVEFLVQRDLRHKRLEPWLKPIATVRYSPAINRDFVKEKAREISAELQAYYRKLNNPAP